jgi:hypothetical protein
LREPLTRLMAEKLISAIKSTESTDQ